MSNEDASISFSEFVELCEEAGISTDNAEVLEQDYRAGRALADAVDALISDQETHPAPYSSSEALDQMDIALSMLEETKDIISMKKMATKLAVHAVRYLAECCHDEGKN